MSTKINQIGAFELEATDSTGWGTAGSVATLSSAIPYLELSKKPTHEFEQDNSIISEAFKDVPRLVTKYAENSIKMNNRFSELDKLFYWAFGFELPVKTVVVLTSATDVTAVMAGGITWSDGTNDYTFLRPEINRLNTFYVFEADDDVAPTGQTGTLTSGESEFEFTSNSGLMYEHLFEIDSNNRHLTGYLAAEQIDGYTEGLLKNRMATIGVKTGVVDIRFQNSLCKKFSLSSSSGGFSELSFDFLSHSQSRGSYGTWTPPAGMTDSDAIVTHHQWGVEIGESETTLVRLGVTDFNIDLDIPLQVIQDTESGLYIAEPFMEGKYALSSSATLSRYSSETFQELRDDWSDVIARFSSTWGFYRQEFLINSAKVSQAGPDDGDVAKEPLTFEIGYGATNNWSDTLYRNTLIHNSPLKLRVRNLNPFNSMLGA